MDQGYSNLTYLSMLISVFRIIRQSQVGEFDQSWDSAGKWISRTRFEYCYGLWMHILARSNAKRSFCLLQMLTDGLECCGLV